MKSKISEYYIFVCLGCTVVGILFAYYLPFWDDTIYFLFLLFPLLLLVVNAYKRFPLVVEICSFLCLIIFSFFYSYIELYPSDKDICIDDQSEHYIYILKIEKEFKTTSTRTQYNAQVYHLEQEAPVYSGRLLCDINKRITIQKFRSYHHCLVKAHYVEVESPILDDVFNYSSYLKNKGFGSGYLKVDSIIRIDSTVRKFDVVQDLTAIRKSFASFIDSRISDNDSKAIIKSLLFGDKTDFELSTIESLRSAGAIHFFCVSGFHVGIVYGLISWLFGLFPLPFRIKNYLRLFIISILLIVYAIICNLSPSVVRAVILLILFLTSDSMSRNTNGWLLFGLGIWIMLLISPLWLFDVGFQLSCSAVLGILIFYKPFQSMLCSRYKFLGKVLNVVSVSLAAQCGVLPILIYYFHSIPVYFILTNLIMVPLVTFLMFYTLGVLLIYWIPILNDLVFFSLDYVCKIPVYITTYISSLPQSEIKHIVLDRISLLFIDSLIVVLGLLFNKFTEKRAFVSFVFAVVLFVSFHYKSEKTIERIKYKNLLITMIYDNEKLFLISNQNLNAYYKLRYELKSFQKIHGINKCQILSPDDFLYVDSTFRLLKLQNYYCVEGDVFTMNGSFRHLHKQNLVFVEKNIE
ncbi:MAG: ComEC/Rec2 family competence protein [Hyphomicrobiales bacterium]